MIKNMQQKKSLLLTTYLSIFLLWLGLGINNNISDMLFWVHTTKLTIMFEWFFILLYINLFKSFPPLHLLWKKYRFIMLIALLWLISISVSFFLSPYYNWQNELALMRFTETLSHLFFFIFLWDFFNKNEVNYSMLFISLILSAFIVLTYLIYLHYAYPDLQMSNYSIKIDSKHFVLNTQFRRIGYLLEVAIIFTFAFLFLKKYHYIAAIAIGILFFSLLAIGGRAALFGTLLAFIIYFFSLKKYISLKIFLTFVIFIGLILSIVLYFNFLNIDYFIYDINRTIQATSFNKMTEGRIEVWSSVLQQLEGKWPIGAGPQSYFFYPGRVVRGVEVIHAHNFILQFLGEWGIVGTLLFLTLLYRAVRYGIILHLHSAPNQERYHLAAGVAIISLSLTGLFGGIYFFPQTSVYLIFCFALWITPSKA